jgi:hypothetical protein
VKCYPAVDDDAVHWHCNTIRKTGSWFGRRRCLRRCRSSAGRTHRQQSTRRWPGRLRPGSSWRQTGSADCRRLQQAAHRSKPSTGRWRWELQVHLPVRLECSLSQQVKLCLLHLDTYVICMWLTHCCRWYKAGRVAQRQGRAASACACWCRWWTCSITAAMRRVAHRTATSPATASGGRLAAGVCLGITGPQPPRAELSCCSFSQLPDPQRCSRTCM